MNNPQDGINTNDDIVAEAFSPTSAECIRAQRDCSCLERLLAAARSCWGTKDAGHAVQRGLTASAVWKKRG